MSNGNGFSWKTIVGSAVSVFLAAIALAFVAYVQTTQTRVEGIRADVIDNCHSLNQLREQLREIILISAQNGVEPAEESDREREFIREALARLQSQDCSRR